MIPHSVTSTRGPTKRKSSTRDLCVRLIAGRIDCNSLCAQTEAPFHMNRRSLLFAMLVALSTVSGCSDSSKNDAGSIGKSIGKNVTEFAQGVGTGVDAQLQIKIELSEKLTQGGLSATVAKQQAPLNDPQKAISVYVISAQELNTTLIAKAYNAEGLEIGRAIANVSFNSNDAQYVNFAFPSEMDRQLVAVYKIDVRAATPEVEE